MSKNLRDIRELQDISRKYYRWNRCILTTAYFPPVSYFVACANSRQVFIELAENYQKQSYRSRCEIYGANGVQKLSVPIRRGGLNDSHSVPITEVEIDYSFPWIHDHKKSIESAYKNSPFYDYYIDELFKILDLKPDRLVELNTMLTLKLLELFSLPDNIKFSSEYQKPLLEPICSDVVARDIVSENDINAGTDIVRVERGESAEAKELNEREQSAEVIDLREVIQPKYKGEDFLTRYKMIKPYWQVFNTKQGFISNLSAIDLLFNEGPDSLSYLKISYQK